MSDKRKATAAERAAAAEAEYLDGLRATWKVPLSEDQYATLRRALLPGQKRHKAAS
jgi:hypothetical protein